MEYFTGGGSYFNSDDSTSMWSLRVTTIVMAIIGIIALIYVSLTLLVYFAPVAVGKHVHNVVLGTLPCIVALPAVLSKQ
jgi:hypothetical protein